ncbi:ATP-binding protein [Streptomyces alfalfae]
MYVCAGVSVPSSDGHSSNGNNGGNKGGAPASSGGGGGSAKKPGKTCASGAKRTEGGLPCEIDGIGDLDEGSMCYIGLADPQPPKSDPVWEGHKDGAIYFQACMNQTGLYGLPDGTNGGAMMWSATNPAGAQGPSAAELAQRALDKMRLDGAKIGSAPPVGSKGLVGMPVWLWTARTPNSWGPISATAAAGGLSVTAKAHVKSIAWSMGDGTSVTCTKPGTPYKKSYGKKESPDCGHTYSKVSADGTFKITANSTWVIKWDATNGETGTLPNETRTADTTINIGELQVVN